MDKTTQQKPELAELIRLSELSRRVMATAHTSLQRRLSVPLMLRDSLQSGPKKWIAGSLAAGLVVSRFLRPRRQNPKPLSGVKKQKGLVMSAVSLAVSAAMPFLKLYAAKLLEEYVSSQLHKSPPSPPRQQRFPRD